MCMDLQHEEGTKPYLTYVQSKNLKTATGARPSSLKTFASKKHIAPLDWKQG